MFLDGLCFITNRKVSRLSHEEMVVRALKAGIKWIQFRYKDGSRRETYKESGSLRNITNDFNAIFIINDHPDIALSVHANGVHLGQDDLPLKEARKIMGNGKLIGVSTHNLDQALDAEKNGADYIGFGPVFDTVTKDAGDPKGVHMLREIKNRVHIPVVAIGGINLENVKSVFAAGTDAVAVASAILSGDIGYNAIRFLDIIRSYRTKDSGYMIQDT
jgi:thiamine-phosphate pyrophosphorylase